MYICICNALKEKELKKVCKKSCLQDPEDVLKQAGCKSECGQCLDYIESFLIPAQNISDPSQNNASF